MKSTLKAALLAAVPIEIVNFWIVGYPTAGNSLTSAARNAAIALEWDLLHLPGLIAIDRIQFLREHAHACSLVFLVAGYIDTAILLAALIFAVRLVLQTLRRLSSPMKHAH
jgi:kynureninase